MYYKNELTEQRVGCWIMAAFLALLPFHFFYSQVALAAFALHTLLFLKKQNIKKAFTLPVLVVSSVYLLSLLSILYSSNKPEGLHIAGKQSALLIMPVLVAISNINFEKHRPLLFSVFAFSCTAVIISLYGYSFYAIQKLNLPASFLFSPGMMNHQFSQPAGIHPTYLSMYVVFSICFFTCLFFGTEKGWKKNPVCCIIHYSYGRIVAVIIKSSYNKLIYFNAGTPLFSPFPF